jgi:hypothetical protein
MSMDHLPESGDLGLDPGTRLRIEVYARAVGCTPGEVVRRAFEAYEAAHDGPQGESEPTALDVFRRAGLIGCLGGAAEGPTDLATNPAHLEGFGRD